MSSVSITITVLVLLLILSLYYNYKFAMIIFRFEDAIENSLDKLDERYGKIQNILDTPLFFDSPQVREVLSDIKECREAVLYVANQLTRIDDGEKKED